MTRIFTRSGHGTGASRPHEEVPAGDELPVGVAAPKAERSGSAQGRVNGRFATREAAAEAGRKGGLARQANDPKRWGRRFGLARLLTAFAPEETFAVALKEREAWHVAQVEYVASTVGGGVCSPGVVSIIATASWERMFSTLMFEAASSRSFAWDVDEGRVPKMLPRTELMMVAARLGDSSRQNLMAAHSLAAVEAKSRAERAAGADDAPWVTSANGRSSS